MNVDQDIDRFGHGRWSLSFAVKSALDWSKIKVIFFRVSVLSVKGLSSLPEHWNFHWSV